MRPPRWWRPHWHRLYGWIPVGAALVALTWLTTTEAGLQVAVRIAHRVTGGALTVSEARGALAYSFELAGLRYEIPAVTVTIERAELSLRLLPLLAGRVQARRLDVEGLLVQTHDTPPAPHRTLTVGMPLGLAVEDGHVADFRLRLGEHGWSWQLPALDFAAQWRGAWITIGRMRAQTREAGEVNSRGRLAFRDDRLLLEDVELKGRGTAHVNGALALFPAADNELSASWRELLWIDAGALDWLSSRRGSAKLSGPWGAYRWSLDGDVLAGGIPGEAVASGRGSLHALAIEQLDLKALAGRVSGNGRIDWSPALAMAFALHWEGLDPGVLAPGWRGLLNGQGTFEAQWPDRVPRLRFDAALADSQLRGYPLTLQLSGRTEDRTVFLKSLRAQSGASVASAQGQLLPGFDLTGDFQSSDLRSLWAGLAGSGALHAQLRGTPRAPELAVRGSLDDLSYARYRAGHAGLDAVLAPQAYSTVALDLTDVRAGAAFRTVSLRAEGTQAKHRLRLEEQGADGAAQLALEGGRHGAEWRGELTQADVTPQRGEAWKLEHGAGLSFIRRRLQVEPVCLASGSSQACAQGAYTPGELRFGFRARAFDLAHLRPWLPGDLALTGTLSGSADLRVAHGQLVDANAELAGSAGSIAAGGSRLSYGAGEVRIQPDGARLRGEVHLRPAGGVLDGEVWVAPGQDLPDRAMSGELRVHLPDLTWLPLLSTEIGSAQGSLDSQLQVSGTVGEPVLAGHLNLAGGRVLLVTPGLSLTDLSASFAREGAAPLALHAEGTSGGGKLVLDGALKQLRPSVAGEVTIKGDDVQGLNTPEARAWVSPDLTLALEQGLARLTGTLTVPRAELTPRQLTGGGIAPSADQVIVEEAGSSRAPVLRIETSVRIALGDDVRIDGLGLKTRLTGAITATDDPEHPTRGSGELRLDGGRYKAYGQDLLIETGRLIFSGGPVTDPAVDLTAYRKLSEGAEGAQKVGLHARGTLEAPQFSLFSEPAMSQEEMLSWLVLGRSLSGSLDNAQTAQLSGAAASLGLTGGAYLAQQLAPTVGLDEVSVGARPGEAADLARFTVGKYLSPKLFVSYGVGLFQPGHFFRMQYDLGKHVKLQGESGTSPSGDILYTIEK